ncbi:hydroxymethylbilane synthase [Corynebacterium glucuronolyticum]|uniref:hydroxymethylbilane synthase n=1 Tax=Corynebacterium glucuronolyticum TaxID=39791 RepID=UPI0021AF794C|nr:hydroxymethylbilane synthase [Corynebacterium glucuronolyticum]
MTLRIGTRGSKLATTQAGHIRDALIRAGYDAELTIITTPGDKNLSPVQKIGIGVFTQALREAMDRDEIDIAVHSCKDLPTGQPEGLATIYPVRETPCEALIARDGLTLDQLPEGAKVGTGAPRRISQLKALRPDLDIRPLRGNVDTRMGKVTSGELDAVILAHAGLTRIGRGDEATQVFDPTYLMPAPAQGILAVESRTHVDAISTLIDDHATLSAQAERAVLSTLQAGCTAPLAAYSTVSGDEITLTAGAFALDGSKQIVETTTGTDPVALGTTVAEKLRTRGAEEIIR